MLTLKNLRLNLLSCAILASSYPAAMQAAPTLAVANSAILADYPTGSTLGFPNVSLSEDGRFMALSVTVNPLPWGSPSVSLSRVYDLYRNQFVNLQGIHPAARTIHDLSASGRYALVRNSPSTSSAVIDLKFATVASGLPRDSFTLSDNGRYLGYSAVPTGGDFVTHGYVYDLTNTVSTLATPRYGSSSDLVTTSMNGFASDILLSGDGKRFFWGTDFASTGFSNGKPNGRDLLVHQWGTASAVNPRVSNCNNCPDSTTDKGGNAYDYSVSADGNIAAFRGYGDYGFTTSLGEFSNGRNQIYTRNLTSLKVDHISVDDNGFIEPDAVAVNYENPSISADGRFVVFNGGGKTYIRDRFAKKKQVLDATSERAYLSGNGKTIVLKKSDGWYRLANPYLVTTTDFTSNYLFANILLVGNAWNNFDQMLLTGNNSWTGYVDYPGTGANSIKLDLGGQWSGSSYVAGSSAGVGFGDNNADGTAAFGEAAIALTQGAGRYKVTFNDQTNQYSVKKLVNVAVSCYNGSTTLGQSVYITGNIPELGNWSPANAVKLSPSAYPTWTGTLALPTNTSIEWKCIKRDELNPATSLVWEPGSNNLFNPSSTQTADGHF